MNERAAAAQQDRRIAVVGVGAITALGPTAADLWSGARDGRVAIRPVQRIDMAGYRTKLAGEVDEVPALSRRHDHFQDRALQLGVAAATAALAKVPAGLVPAERFGVVLGTCNAGLLAAREWLRQRSDGTEPDPALVRMITPQALAEQLGQEFGLRGPTLAVNTACASGANAIGLAAELVRRGRADAVLAGGTEALSDVVFAGFNALESLSADPAAPYSASRCGLSLGEGSGMVVLVRADLAHRLELPVLAEVLGYGLSADGYHPTAPRPCGTGAAGAIRSGLLRSGVDPAEVGYVNGHGTGTQKNDSAETNAIHVALGPAADTVLVSSTKSVIGHLLGAAGAVEAIVTMHALAEGVAPPTASHTADDPECDLDYVTAGPKPFTHDVAVSNSFAFAGANAALVLARAGSRAQPEPRESERVVVTGIAVLSPAGDSPDDAWLGFVEQRDCCSWEDGHRIGRVRVDPEPYLTRRERRRMDRLGVLSVVASAKALASAGIEPGTPASSGIGVLFGTGVGPMEAMEQFVLPLLDEGSAAADPGVFPNTVYNQAAGQIAMRLALHGPTSTLSVGHATGAATISYAADLLAAGHADAMVAITTDVLTDQVVHAYASQRVLSDGMAPGLALAEGSVALVLERRSAALARGATIFGEVLGAGSAADARRTGLWDARGRGLERAMLGALQDGGRSPADVDGVWLAAAGLDAADRAENRALHRVFGAGVVPPRYAPKVLLGEPMGVGGALSVALALHDFGASGVHAGERTALVNSSSLGGSHVSLLIGREERA